MRGVGRSLGTGVVALALLAAGAGLREWLPADDDDPGAEPHVVRGEVGDVLDLRTATLRVDEVSGSTRVSSYGDELVSPGLWVLVRYTVEAVEENTAITFAELADAEGRTWGLVGRNENRCTDSPPGLPAHCAAAFEVPVDALPTLVVRLARQSRDTRFDALAEVDLGLTAEHAWVFGEAAPLELPDPVLGEQP